MLQSYCTCDLSHNQRVSEMALLLVSWRLCTRSYVPILSIGEDLKEIVFGVGPGRTHHIRYLITNFGNVENLGFSVW